MSVGDNVEIRLSPSGPVVFTTGAQGQPVPMVVGRGMVLRMVEAASSAISQSVTLTEATLVSNVDASPFTVEMPECDPARLYICEIQVAVTNSADTPGDLCQFNLSIEATRDNGANWVQVARTLHIVQENTARTVITKRALSVLPVTFPLVAGETIKLRARCQQTAGANIDVFFESRGEPGGCVFTLVECQP